MFKKIIHSLFVILLIASMGCTTLDTQPINLQDTINIEKVEFPVIGNLQLALYDAQGQLKDYREYHNLVTSVGKAGVASRINGAGSEVAFTYIAIGTGTNAAAAGDTTLQTEITTGGGARASASCTRTTVTVTNDTAQLQATFSFTTSFAVTESGTLNAASSGVLLARRVFSAINVVNGDSLSVTWKFTTS